MASVEELIRHGGVRLAFDTNALSSHNRFFDVCNLANRLRASSPLLDLQLIVPAVVHGEHLLHIRHEIHAKGKAFDGGLVQKDLERKGLQIAAFGSEDAENTAEFIAGQFTEDAAWQTAKRNFAGRQLGLTSGQLEAAQGKKLSATVDWLIAGQTAANPQWILVTNDQGLEFEALSRKVTLEGLEAALGRLLGESLA